MEITTLDNMIRLHFVLTPLPWTKSCEANANSVSNLALGFPKVELVYLIYHLPYKSRRMDMVEGSFPFSKLSNVRRACFILFPDVKNTEVFPNAFFNKQAIPTNPTNANVA